MVLPRSIHIPWRPWRDGPGALVAILGITVQAFATFGLLFAGCD